MFFINGVFCVAYNSLACNGTMDSLSIYFIYLLQWKLVLVNRRCNGFIKNVVAGSLTMVVSIEARLRPWVDTQPINLFMFIIMWLCKTYTECSSILFKPWVYNEVILGSPSGETLTVYFTAFFILFHFYY